MKLSPLLLILIFAPTAHAGVHMFFEDLINFILEILFAPVFFFIVPGICNAGILAVGLTGLVECDCSGMFKDLGIVASADCTAGVDGGCLLPDLELFCFDGPSGGASLELTLSGADGFAGGFEASFSLDSGLPPELDPFSPLTLELTAQADGLELTSCTVTLNGEDCTCTPCEPPAIGAFSFDCTDVELVLGIPGPAIDCVELPDIFG